ncbi:hypothetical protein PSACC_00452, partial [Paramicrosporidium saccamoebae]
EELLPLVSYDPRMLISFAVTSAQCIDESKYTALLKGPISEILARPRPSNNVNDFVDSVLRINTQYQGLLGDYLPRLQPFLMKYWDYRYRMPKLPASLGTFAHCYSQEPAILEKGRIYVVQSIVSSDASFSVAEKLYHKTLGEKVWIPLRHATTAKMPQFVEKILAAEIAESTSTVVQDCIDADVEIGTDWKKSYTQLFNKPTNKPKFNLWCDREWSSPTMRLSATIYRIPWPTAISIVLLLSRGTGSTGSGLKEPSEDDIKMQSGNVAALIKDFDRLTLPALDGEKVITGRNGSVGSALNLPAPKTIIEERHDIQKLRDALNSKDRTSVLLPDNFKLSPELVNGLTLDGAKTLFEIVLNVPNYDEFAKATTNIGRDKVTVASSPLTDELVSTMGPDVCALFANHHLLFEHPEVALEKCISVFIASLNTSEHPQEMLKRLPMDWFAQRPVELLNALTTKQLDHLFQSNHELELDNPSRCQELTVEMAVKLVRLNVIPSNRCISKITGLDTMEFESSHLLFTSPEAFCYYNGPLSKSVTAAMMKDQLETYASKVKGDMICQNLRLEFVTLGVDKVTVRCLHGYFHAVPKPLDIGAIPDSTIEQWISKYPSDVRNLKPEYFEWLPYSCWKHILGCRDNLNKEFLETIVPGSIRKPITLGLPPESLELIDLYAPHGFLESVQTQFITKSLLEALNVGCHETAKQMVKLKSEYPNEFFSGLAVTGARALLGSSRCHRDYDSFLRSEAYWSREISLRFTDCIMPDNVPANPEVCAVLLHAVRDFRERDKIPPECWELHINELVRHTRVSAQMHFLSMTGPYRLSYSGRSPKSSSPHSVSG